MEVRRPDLHDYRISNIAHGIIAERLCHFCKTILNGIESLREYTVLNVNGNIKWANANLCTISSQRYSYWLGKHISSGMQIPNIFFVKLCTFYECQNYYSTWLTFYFYIFLWLLPSTVNSKEFCCCADAIYPVSSIWDYLPIEAA